jgi:hypothetical protein
MRDKKGKSDSFCAKLSQGGLILLAKVSGAIDVDPGSSGQPPRSGYFQIPPNHPLRCGEEYDLQLDSGHSLTSVLTALVPPGYPAVARFVEVAS